MGAAAGESSFRFASLDDCNAALRNAGYPGIAHCDKVGAGGAPVHRSRGARIALGTVASSLIGGTIANAMVPQGYSPDYQKRYTINGAEIGGGIALALGGAVNSAGLGPAGTAVTMGTGAAIAVYGASKNQALNGAEDVAAKNAVLAGVGAGGAGLLLGHVAKAVMPGVRMPSGTTIGLGGRQAWFRWRW